jgi:hypothetical protein
LLGRGSLSLWVRAFNEKGATARATGWEIKKEIKITIKNRSGKRQFHTRLRREAL